MLIITNKFLCHKRGTGNGERMSGERMSDERVSDFVFRFPFSVFTFYHPPLRDKVRCIFCCN